MKLKLLLMAVIIFTSTTAMAKMPNPFQGQLTPDEVTAELGATLPITLEFQTASTFKTVEVAVKLPDGLRLVSGEKKAVLTDVKPNTPQTFKYKVKVVKSGEQQFLVTAKALNLGEGQSMGGAFLTRINPENPEDKAEIKTEADGTEVMVTRVKSN